MTNGKTNELKVGDIVIYQPNGLWFKVENNKMLRWMEMSGNYIKREDGKKENSILRD